MVTLTFLLILTTASPVFSALPSCASGVTCPTGGIWSEWTSSQKCSADCGSCAKQLYTRRCLSTSANCKCTGDISRYVLCKTQTCAYPAQRTCCIPYVSMLLNGTFQCGPVPKIAESTASCCPIGGLWSDWSKFGRNGNNTMWVRSRKCVSEEAGCECTGDAIETKTGCPCRDMIVVDTIVQGGFAVYPRDFVVDDDTCTYTANIIVNTLTTGNSRPCNAWGDYALAAIIRYTKPSEPQKAVDFRVLDCFASPLPERQRIVTFHCDMDVLYWRLDYNNDFVNGWVQLNLVAK